MTATAATTTEAAATTNAIHATPAQTDPTSIGKEVGRLFSEHSRMVFALCNVLLRDRPEAEDATQQCFLSAQRSMRAGVVPADAGAWLAAIARNECLSRLRRRRPETVALRDDDLVVKDDLAEVVDRRMEIEALSAVIAGLPPAQRQAVVLRDFYGLSYHEVSVALGVTGPAVESLLFKSRKRLQERLRPFRTATGVAAVPTSIRDALIRKIPGFSSGLPAGSVGPAVLTAKLLSGHAAAKLAALAIVAGAGTVAFVHEQGRPPRAAPAPPLVLSRADFQPAAPSHDIQVHPTAIFTRIPPRPKVVRQAVPPIPAVVTQTVPPAPVPAPVIVRTTPPPPPPAPVRVVRLPAHITVTLPGTVVPVVRGKEPDDPALPEAPSAPPSPVITEPSTGESNDSGSPPTVTSPDDGAATTTTDGSDGETTTSPAPVTTTTATTTTTTTTATTTTGDDSGGGGGDHHGDGGSTTTTTTTFDR
jgi:RNA polymerase sigma-70 factor (ECF subfamily)